MDTMDRNQDRKEEKRKVLSLYVQAAALVTGALCGVCVMMEHGHRLLGAVTAGSAAVAGAALVNAIRCKCLNLPGDNAEIAAASIVEGIAPEKQQIAATVDPVPACTEPTFSTVAATEPNADVASLCVLLYDELDQNIAFFDEEKRHLAEHVMARIEDILTAAGAVAIRDETTYNRLRHQPDKIVNNGAAIAATLSPGFALGRRVLRRARVHIA